MKSIKILAIIFTAVLLLQACTLASLQLGNKLKTRPSPKYVPPCKVKYHISIEYSGSFFFRIGHPLDPYRKPVLPILPKYIKTTQEIIEEKGCTASSVGHKEANLRIRIVKSASGRLLLQDLQDTLTYRFYGLIPTWGTREGAYKYYFETVNETLSYSADLREYSHLLFLPLALPYFLTTLVVPPELDLYREVLVNFIGEF